MVNGKRMDHRNKRDGDKMRERGDGIFYIRIIKRIPFGQLVLSPINPSE